MLPQASPDALAHADAAARRPCEDDRELVASEAENGVVRAGRFA